MRFILFMLFAVTLLAPTFFAASQGSSDSPPGQNRAAQVERGAELYAWNCAVCHGDTGLGQAEARKAFPEDHRRCERCHKPNNPSRMTMQEMAPNNAFSVGTPPPLRGKGALAGYPNASALYHYLRAAMPRYEPGRLSDADYLDITAFLLELGGYLPEDVVLDEAGAALLTIDGN